MSEEFYCALKLVTGEEIFSLISIDETTENVIIILQNPVIMKIINNSRGMYVKIKSWMDIPQDDIYIINFDKVVTMTEIKDSMAIEFYKKFLSDETDDTYGYENKKNGEVKISNQMGYISSVEDARKNLENLFKNS
jgi:hypothetical protein